MKQPRNSLWARVSVATFLLFGIMDGELMKAHGQTQGKSTLFTETGRDPFSLPSGIRLLTQTGPNDGTNRRSWPSEKTAPSEHGNPAETSSAAMTVKAILMTDRIRLASIDRHIVTAGDSIRDEKVLEILADRVILGKGGKQRTLLLYQSPVRLTVDQNQGGKK